MHKFNMFTVFCALLVLALPGSAAAKDVDAGLPDYTKAGSISGSINSVGSDTMNNLMALWCEGFQKYYPSVRCQIEGKGSSTAPPALIEGTAQVGPMSRPMKSSEADKFEAKFGYKPMPIKTSLDSLAVYVNKDNPVECLTIEQVDGIFSKSQACGGDAVGTWDAVGLEGDWKGRPLSLYGRNSASGTYAYFKKHALCKGDYRDQVKEQPGSASVVQGITKDRYGIGYSGIGYITSGVKALSLAKKGTTDCREPKAASILDGSYPLGRFLYIYVNQSPTKGLDPLVKEFVTYILSKEGQQIVIKDGYDPLPAGIVKDMLKAIQ